MLSTMNLDITWGGDPDSWQWIPTPDSRYQFFHYVYVFLRFLVTCSDDVTQPYTLCRFETVVELLKVCFLEIRGRIKSRYLSPRTRYSAYIVFKKADIHYGFENVAVEVVVGVVGQDLEESCRRYVCFEEATNEQFIRRNNIVQPERRHDGWMEIKLGEFFNQGGLMNKDQIDMVILEAKQRHWKRGLIIQGIEIRPAKIP